MAIKNELIEEIRARTDLVKLVGEYVPLRRSGRRYVGLCPFHHEASPSFGVNPEWQIFYCFGCKASGDAFEFIMRLEGLDFINAAKLLAERAGLKWEAQTPEDAAREKHRANLLRLNGIAAEVYRRALAAPRTGLRARSYLERRRLASDSIARFGLGYAPPGLRTLVEIFRRHGCRLEDAAEIGLVLASARGYIDRLRDRIIFPLIDLGNRVVGFGARIIDDGQPKYLNSPDSAVFNKSKFLYGLHLAREAIRRSRTAVLVEGYLDVIAVHQAGITNAVASLGTSLTEHHADLLKRFADEVILAYDGDNAGQEATTRGLNILQKKGLLVKVAVLPPGQDPDDLIRREGVASLQTLIASALPLTEFLLQRAVVQADLTTPEGRAAAVQSCLPVLAAIESAAAREGYVRQVASRIRVHEDIIMSDLVGYLHAQGSARHKMDNTGIISNTNRCRAPAQNQAMNPAEKELLRTVLKEYSILARIKKELRAEDFTPGPLRDIYNHMLNHPGPHFGGGAAALPEETRRIYLELVAAADDDAGPPLRPEALPKLIGRIKAGAIRRRLLELEAERMAIEETGGQEERLNECLRQEYSLRHQLEQYQKEFGLGML